MSDLSIGIWLWLSSVWICELLMIDLNLMNPHNSLDCLCDYCIGHFRMACMNVIILTQLLAVKYYYLIIFVLIIYYGSRRNPMSHNILFVLIELNNNTFQHINEFK